jgi:hypothetical protein
VSKEFKVLLVQPVQRARKELLAQSVRLAQQVQFQLHLDQLAQQVQLVLQAPPLQCKVQLVLQVRLV